MSLKNKTESSDTPYLVQKVAKRCKREYIGNVYTYICNNIYAIII